MECVCLRITNLTGVRKSTKDLQISAPQPRNLDDSNAIDQNFFDFEGVPNPSYEASVYSLSRQMSGQSTSSIKSKFKGLKAPFSSNKFGSSMTDLPNPPSLRHHASNPSLGRQWTTGSSTHLGFAPPSFHPMARPSTSDGRSKTWVNPLDVHFSRDSSKPGFKGPLSPGSTMQDDGSPSTPLSATSKSPLGRYELKLDLPEDVSSFADFGNFKDIGEAPAPLRIRKPASIRLAERPQTSNRPQKPPSPPQSIIGKDPLRNAVPEPPRRPATAGPHTGSRACDKIPSGLEELQNAISNFGPTSLPSPSTTPRESEEKPSTTIPARPASPSTKKGNPKPVIQNVIAKRDTLTINPQRRRSLEMKIEAAEAGNVPSLSLADRPKTSGGIRSNTRPPPLTLNMGFRSDTANRDGLRTAPFLPNPMQSLTPAGAKSSAQQRISGQGEPGQPASVNKSSKHRSGANSPTGSSVYDDDDEVYHHPPSPESTSPVIPLTGPLASPCFPPASQSPLSSGAFQYPRKDDMTSGRALSPTTPPVPPRSLRRNPPTPDSSHWPVPSPAATSFDRAAKSPSPADSRLRSESESDSLYGHEPLGPPRIPATRSGAESPTFRSFSRPRSPTTAGGPKTSSLKRSETTGPQPVLGAGGEFGGGLRPPPRSVTVKTAKTDASTFKSPAVRIGKNGLGGGFI